MSEAVDLENLCERLTLTDDADPGCWPTMEVEIEPTYWSPADPDVGIDYPTLEDWDETYTLDGEGIVDLPGFALAIHAIIGKDIAETAEQLQAIIGQMIRDTLDQIEPEDSL